MLKGLRTSLGGGTRLAFEAASVGTLDQAGSLTATQAMQQFVPLFRPSAPQRFPTAVAVIAPIYPTAPSAIYGVTDSVTSGFIPLAEGIAILVSIGVGSASALRRGAVSGLASAITGPRATAVNTIGRGFAPPVEAISFLAGGCVLGLNSVTTSGLTQASDAVATASFPNAIKTAFASIIAR